MRYIQFFCKKIIYIISDPSPSPLQNTDLLFFRYPPNNDGGFASNPDTKYMFLSLSLDFGEILVLRGKMPTHQTTWDDENKIQMDTQVQYFSISIGGSPPSGEGWNTTCDEQFALDESGYFTLVISRPWNRPSNAIVEEGANWMDLGGAEGYYTYSRNWVSNLYIRYQNTNPDWKNSPSMIPIPTIQNPIPQDPIVMGPYYPIGTYMSKENFEKSFNLIKSETKNFNN